MGNLALGKWEVPIGIDERYRISDDGSLRNSRGHKIHWLSTDFYLDRSTFIGYRINRGVDGTPLYEEVAFVARLVNGEIKYTNKNRVPLDLLIESERLIRKILKLAGRL